MVIDEGTTGVRTMIFDRALNLQAKAYETLNLMYPHPDFVEQSPAEVYERTVSTIKKAVLAGGIDPKEIECIGISTQRVTWVPWRRSDGEPLMNMATWMDRRGIPRHKELKADKEFERRFPEMYNSIQPQHIACGLGWHLRQDENLRRMMDAGELMFGTVDTWIVYKLTRGKVFASNASNAGTTRLIDNRTLNWNVEAMKYLGINPDMFPEVKNEADDYGMLDKDILGVEIPITGVVADQQSALFAQACLTPWTVKSTNGTGSFVTFNLGDKSMEGKGPYASIVGWKLPNQVRFMAEGFLPTAGSALEWLKNEAHLIDEFGELHGIIHSVPDSGGVFFSPALNGFRAPLNDATAKAGFLGISGGVKKAHLVRSVVEAIAFANAHVIEDIGKWFHVEKPETVKISGGVAQEELLGQLIANVVGTKVEKPVSLEASAIGAAEFAGIYAGIYTLEDIPRLLTVEKVYEPDANAQKDVETYEKWKKVIERTTKWEF